MKVISTETLIHTAREAMFEENYDFTTDIEHVIDFLEIMEEHHGFELVRCKDCKHNDACEIAHRFGEKEDWFCADGEPKDS